MRCSGHSVILYFDKAETLLHGVAKYDRETERVQSLHFYITHCTALLCYLSVGKLFVLLLLLLHISPSCEKLAEILTDNLDSATATNKVTGQNTADKKATDFVMEQHCIILLTSL